MEFQEIIRWLGTLPGFDIFFHWLAELPHLSRGEQFRELVEAFLKLLGLNELIKFLYKKAFRRRSKLESKIEQLEEELGDEKLDSKTKSDRIKSLEAEIKSTKETTLDHALKIAQREWDANNEKSAQYALDQWFIKNKEPISKASVAMAKYHIANSIPDPTAHLVKARNLLQVARSLAPEREDLQSLWHEFDKVNAALQEQVLRDDSKQIGWNAQMRPEPLIETFRDAASFSFNKGHWQIAPLFADRAAVMARTETGIIRATYIAAETEAAFYHDCMGNSHSALKRFDKLINDPKNTSAENELVMLDARLYRAETLNHIGEYAQSRREYDHLIPISSKLRGEKSDTTLRSRFHRAENLGDLRLYDEALAELDMILPMRIEAEGSNPRDLLVTRYERTKMLNNLDRSDEALEELDRVMSKSIVLDGPEHPSYQVYRRLRAEILYRLGRHHDAEAEIDAAIPKILAALGPDHPFYLGNRSYRIGIDIDQKKNVDYESELRSLISQLAAKCGAQSGYVDGARYRLARLLFVAGRNSEAKDEVNQVIENFIPGTPTNNSYLKSAMALLEMIEGRPTDVVLMP